MKSMILFIIFFLNYVASISQIKETRDAIDLVDRLKNSIALTKNGRILISCKIKGLDSKDTAFGIMQAKFRKDAKSNLGILINANIKTDSVGFQLIYDGKSIYRTESDKRRIIEIDPKQYGYGFVTSYSLLYYLFVPQHPLLIDSSINALFADKNLSEIKTGNDTIIDKEQCLEIILYYHPMKNFYKSRITSVYIDSKTFLPVRSLNILVSPLDDIQYTEFNIQYDNLNSFNNDDEFSFESLPKDFVMQNYSDAEVVPFIAVGSKAPDFSLRDLDNKTVSLKNYLGKLVLLDFWHMHCGYCIISMPETQEIFDRYKSDNLVVLGINPYDRDKKKLKAFIENNKINFTQLINGLAVNSLYKVYAHPTYYLIDRKGKIIFVGIFDKQKINSLIENELSTTGNSR